MVKKSGNTNIPRSFKARVTKRDRISRKQLTSGLKKSLGSGKRMSVATKYLRKEGEGLLKSRSFNRTQVTNRLKSLKEGGFLRKSARVAPISKKIHTPAAARNKMEKTVEKNIEVRKKDYQREGRVKENEKDWLIEEAQRSRELERKEERKHERDRLEEVSQGRRTRAETRRAELGLGPVDRNAKATGKVDKHNILAEIRKGGGGSDRPQGLSMGRPKDEPGNIGGGAPDASTSVGNGGWSAPPSNSRKGL